MNEPAFDVLAHNYDEAFSKSSIGFNQRMISRKWLKQLLDSQPFFKILEINCGTGDDAIWISSMGHEVIATDQSPRMIDTAKKKIELHNQNKFPKFIVSDFNHLIGVLENEKFDLIFSNFAGLNCVEPGEMESLGNKLSDLLKPQGHLAIVIFGKHCWWETAYYLFRLKAKTAFRRWTDKEVKVELKPGVFQTVHYYSITVFLNYWKKFRLIDKKPVGLFIPPSYLEKAVQKRPGLFRILNKLEKTVGKFSFTSSWADHSYVLFKKVK